MSSNTYRIENDSLGPIQVPANVFYGIQSLHAREKFPHQTTIHLKWYKAMETVINPEIHTEYELPGLFNGFILHGCLLGKRNCCPGESYATGI